MENCEYVKLCEEVAVEIRELIFDDASDVMQGAMIGQPGEIFGFAREWIKKQKGLSYEKTWFKSSV